MPTYHALHGTFHVKGYSPDGDSIRFQATDPALWDRFKWSTAAAQKAARKQLRLEAIDALETHYEGCHQPRAFGLAALEQLLSSLGITGVRYNLLCTQIVSASDGTPGTVLVRELDRYDRPICFAFAGTTRFKNGAPVDAAKLSLKPSANWQMADAGLAYATFYTSQDEATREQIRAVVAKARKAKRGLWALDRTNSGFDIDSPSSVEDDVVILPKLFRRLVEFLGSAADYSELPAWHLRMKEPVTVLGKTPLKTTLGTLLELQNRRLRLTEKPDDLLFGD